MKTKTIKKLTRELTSIKDDLLTSLEHINDLQEQYSEMIAMQTNPPQQEPSEEEIFERNLFIGKIRFYGINDDYQPKAIEIFDAMAKQHGAEQARKTLFDVFSHCYDENNILREPEPVLDPTVHSDEQ